MPLPVHRKKPSRSVDVKQRTKYRGYKDQLRSDFNRCCGYCGDDDFFVGGSRGFHIDHFAPKSLFEHLESDYSNLVYSCPFCNIAKSNGWLSDSEHVSVVNEKGYIDPCCDEFDSHLRRAYNGQIVAKSKTGQYMYDNLKLYLLRHRLCWTINELQYLIDELKSLGLDSQSEYHALVEKHYNFISLLRDEQ